MSAKRLLKIRLSLKGRPIKTYTFNKEVITVGRNPEADIFLDNPGVSRDHLKLEMTTRGFYAVEDLGSANGTFLNDQPIKREYLMNNDVVHVGKFSIWVSYEEDRRGTGADRKTAPQMFEGTTVLSTDELEEMIHHAQEAESSGALPAFASPAPSPDAAAAVADRPGPSWAFLASLVLLAFVLGTFLGPRMPWAGP